MGRRRWKQYQDTLYSGTRSSESATAQPHHRLYPALSSSCNPIPGSLDQIGSQLHHPAPSSLPSTVASTALTTAATTTTTATATGVVKQESLQRHHLQNHHHHPQSAPLQDRRTQQEDPRRLRPPGEVKVEAGDEVVPVDGIAREDASARTTDTGTVTTTTTATAAGTATTAATTTTTSGGTATTVVTGIATTTTGTTTIATRRRRGVRRQNDGEEADAVGEEDGEENDGETGRGQNEAEKRLKLDEGADRSVSPLRTENDRGTRDHPTANATDTEGTKVWTDLSASSRVHTSREQVYRTRTLMPYAGIAPHERAGDL